MIRHIARLGAAAALVFLCAVALQAQDLVYTPINPSFGGNSFNASWLLSEAQAQNGFTEKGATSAYGSYSNDPLTNFKNSLNQQILSQLSRQLVTQTFGEQTLKDGHYEIGDYIVDVTSGLEGINIAILDRATGAQSNILVPFF